MLDFMKILGYQFFVGLLCLFICTTAIYAQDKAPVEMKLLAGGPKGERVLVGVLLTIPKNWHVYAPNPKGEEGAGFEPEMTWEKSTNLKSAKILWPIPHKTEIQDQSSYVYEGQTLIPLELIPYREKDPIALKLKVSFLACSSMCIPLEETLSITLQPNEKQDPAFKAILQQEKENNELSLFILLTIALLGGFILNFMPCVLPVLSLKVMSLVKQSKKSHTAQAKHSFFITGLGILTSFLLLALLTVVLKASGSAFGWGIHFQNPHFLLFIFLVLVAFSASLGGIFEIDLPSGLGTWLITHEGKGRVKDFLSGVFATLLATPCSAPFVGTALTFALARNSEDIFLVFFFLGLGFAFPYFLVASLPQRYILLPKPGAWMAWVQGVLGVGLALTALWVGWILSFHLALWVLFLSTFLALIALSLFWVKHHKKPSLKAWLYAAPLFLLAWSLSWVTLDTKVDLAHKQAKGSPHLELWQPFDPLAIHTLVSQGKTVFVDATAEWCVTCAVNKSLVLNDPAITSLLVNPNVIAMRADWTKQDPTITSFLQK
ncbi:MAG TPA: protein-disulfide reductase DsbD domain-containing protein, partial [Alphaproteobacteria bacterium]|nr:protein-disulfide reductase DsbD domain-containing protein [Alphaproteobacteria bacterium]